MLDDVGARYGEKGNTWLRVLSVTVLVISVYELLGVIYIRVSERPFKVEYTKLLQSLVSLLLVGHLAITVNLTDTFYRDSTSCLKLPNIWWLSYFVLTAVIHIFYWIKQRVLAVAIGTKTIFWWLRPLRVFCFFLIIFIFFVGIVDLYENNICSRMCSTNDLAEGLMYQWLDFCCVVLLLILFVLPLWRFMRRNDDMNQSQPLKRALIRNVVLCCTALFTSIILYVNWVVSYYGVCNTVYLHSEATMAAMEQFVICNCILGTMADWKQYLLWPCTLASKINPTLDRSNSRMTEHMELLLKPESDIFFIN